MDAQFWPVLAFLMTLMYFLVYSLLDGFDLGIGCLVPFAKKAEADRLISQIAPFWDGNEVWLVMGAGFLFGAFPVAYAALLSACYLPFMAVIAAFILRGAALEFSYHDAPRLRLWRRLFGLGSFLAGFSELAALGLLLQGLPFTAPGTVDRGLPGMPGAFPILFGVAGLLYLVWHGITYALGREPSPFLFRAAKLVWYLVAGASLLTICFWMRLSGATAAKPLVLLGGLLYLVGLALGRVLLAKGAWPFRMSCLGLLGLWLAAGAALFPNLLIASGNPAWSLTVYQAASPDSTLRPLAIASLILIPSIAGYSIFVYRIMHGAGYAANAEREGTA